MKNLHRQFVHATVCTVFIMTLSLFSGHPIAAAQEMGGKNIAVTVPAESIEKFVGRLLPYTINLGRGFSGNFLVKSIEKIRIKENTIYFSSYVYGENVAYKTKIGKQEAALSFGDINLHNQWRITYRHDAKRGVVYVKPHLVDPKTDKKSSQGDMLLTALFGGLSDIEYPVDLQKLSPMTTELFDKDMTVRVNITGIRSSDNALIVFIEPIPEIVDRKKEG